MQLRSSGDAISGGINSDRYFLAKCHELRPHSGLVVRGIHSSIRKQRDRVSWDQYINSIGRSRADISSAGFTPSRIGDIYILQNRGDIQDCIHGDEVSQRRAEFRECADDGSAVQVDLTERGIKQMAYTVELNTNRLEPVRLEFMQGSYSETVFFKLPGYEPPEHEFSVELQYRDPHGIYGVKSCVWRDDGAYFEAVPSTSLFRVGMSRHLGYST